MYCVFIAKKKEQGNKFLKIPVLWRQSKDWGGFILYIICERTY